MNMRTSTGGAGSEALSHAIAPATRSGATPHTRHG